MISPLVVDFGNQPENSTSASKTIILTNAVSQNLTITNAIETGPDAGQFSSFQGGDPGSRSCQIGVVLPPAGQCVARLTFDPNTPRTSHAEMDFYDNPAGAPNPEQIVALIGVGTVTAPIVSLAVPSLMFGSENVGSRCGAQSVTLTKLGSGALNLSSIILTGTNAPDFAIATAGTSCPISGGIVIAQASCSVAVQLAPQTAGTKNASLSFADDAPGNPQQLPLSGTGTAAPSLQVSPPSLTFAAQSESATSAPQSATILNAGGAAAEISGIAISGPNADDFSAPASCTPNSVAAGKSCQIGVTFTPGTTTPGVRSATLSVPTGNPPMIAWGRPLKPASLYTCSRSLPRLLLWARLRCHAPLRLHSWGLTPSPQRPPATRWWCRSSRFKLSSLRRLLELQRSRILRREEGRTCRAATKSFGLPFCLSPYRCFARSGDSGPIAQSSCTPAYWWWHGRSRSRHVAERAAIRCRLIPR